MSEIDQALAAVTADLVGTTRPGVGRGASVLRLRSSWQHVLQLMARGEAPGLRACPHCGGVGLVGQASCLLCSRDHGPSGS